jgi:hypothetical protein
MHRGDAFRVSAVSAAVVIPPGLNPMSDDFAATMFALECERVNRAFETVKIMRNPRYDDFDRFVVLVSTNFTSMHSFTFGLAPVPVGS